MNYLERIYGAVVASDVSTAFAVVIAVIFGLSLLARFPAFARPFGALERSGSALLTTLGVLGTFTGIFIGLLDFDVSKIDESVPQLLAGLKIAFVTSILGMGAAIALKIVQALTPQPSTEKTEVTPEDIYAALTSINESVDKASEQQMAALDEVRKAISSEGDSSLLTQVQKLRTTVLDGLQELIKEFRDFAQTMAENNSKALIEALESVIRDFNTQLNEQFGENFKQLNEAVGALLTWQENYRNHVEALEDHIEAAVRGIEASETALKEIVGHTERIPEALSSMEEVLAGLMGATEDLKEHLEAVSLLKEQALEAFPVIDENLKRLTDEFGETVRQSLNETSATLQKQREALDGLREGYDTLLETSSEAQERFGRALEGALESMQDTQTKAMEGHAQTIEATANEMQRQVGDAWTKTQDTITEQVRDLDELIKTVLTRTLVVLGRNLASLSEKFVEDYEPLTHRLRDIVQIAGRAS